MPRNTTEDDITAEVLQRFGQTPDRNNDDAAPHRERENTTSASRTRFYKFGCGLKQESPAMAGLLRTVSGSNYLFSYYNLIMVPR